MLGDGPARCQSRRRPVKPPKAVLLTGGNLDPDAVLKWNVYGDSYSINS
jgi:hypothetical protein